MFDCPETNHEIIPQNPPVAIDLRQRLGASRGLGPRAE